MSPEQGSRAVLYLRVSLSKQVEDGHSLDAQRERLNEYAEAHGLTVVDVVVDGGETGGSLDRPGFGRVREMVGAGEVDVIVATKGDRIARSLLDLLNLVAELQAQGVSISLTDEDFDTATPAGELMVQVRGAVAQYERALIRQRTREGMAAAKRKGVRLGRPPVGYTVQDGKLVPVDGERYEVVKRAVALRDEGLSLRAIADLFNADGIPTGLRGQWYAASVSRLLRGPLATQT